MTDWLKAKIDNGIRFLGPSNLAFQTNYSNNKISKQTQIVPSSSIAITYFNEPTKKAG